MIRRALRLMIRLSLLVGAALVVSKVVQARREEQAGSKQPFGGGPSPVPPPTPGMVRSPETAKPAAVKPAAVKPAVVETEKVATAVTPPPEPASASPSAPASAKSDDDKVVVGRSQPPPVEPWVDPDVAGLCPSSHPVKAKLTSGIYHLPGMAAYVRTRADRCYCDEDAAQTDGLRKAKR